MPATWEYEVMTLQQSSFSLANLMSWRKGNIFLPDDITLFLPTFSALGTTQKQTQIFCLHPQ